MSLHAQACTHLRDIVRDAIGHQPPAQALVVFDRHSALATLLADAYRDVLPHAQMLDFDTATPEYVRVTIDALRPGDLVVLVQSSSFRLNEFRFRLELFARHLAVIEHPHLGRMGEHEYATYIAALAYDKDYYHTVGKRVKEKIDRATSVTLTSKNGDVLTYATPLEDAKMNIGDYTGMKNVGGQFPIGEVFTEPKDIFAVNGWVEIYAFGDATFRVVVPERPVRLHIVQGVVVEVADSCPAFDAVLAQIRADEEVWVRELGFGMNRALTRTTMLSDIGSYERMCGIHLSLGQKHTIYTKPGMPKRSSKYHVDVFVDVDYVLLDDVCVFREGTYLL